MVSWSDGLDIAWYDGHREVYGRNAHFVQEHVDGSVVAGVLVSVQVVEDLAWTNDQGAALLVQASLEVERWRVHDGVYGRVQDAANVSGLDVL